MAIFFDWPEMTGALNDQEKGRLIDAIVLYARGDGGWKDRIKGNERFVFPMFQGMIDRYRRSRAARVAASRENGKQGGRPRRSAAPASETQGFESEASVFSETQGFESEASVFSKTLNNNKKEYKYEKDNENEGVNPEEEDERRYQATQGPEGVIASVWRHCFGNQPNPTTLRAIQRWATYCGYDRADFIEEAVSAAAARNANDPVGYIIALFKDWRARGISDVDDLD